MAVPTQPVPVKLFIAALYRDTGPLQRARKKLTSAFGPTDYVSPAYPFAHAGYYAEEMGEPLHRRFFSFRELIDPGAIVACKLRTNEIEAELSEAGKRTVNLDAGYLDYGKVVLASMKFHNQKIYLAEGVYADMNLLYEKDRFKPFEWTFPDFRSGTYDRALLHIRSLYKADMRRRQGSSRTG